MGSQRVRYNLATKQQQEIFQAMENNQHKSLKLGRREFALENLDEVENGENERGRCRVRALGW